MLRLSLIPVVGMTVLLAACTPDAPHGKKADTQGVVQAADNLRKSGDAGGAVRMLRDAQAKTPEDPDVLLHLGYALIAADEPEEAVNIFDKLLALHPDNALAYGGKAVAFDHAGNHLAAQDLYEKALAITPDSLSLQNNLAMSMILNDQLDQALALLEKLNRRESNPTVRQNLAMAYALTGDSKKALALNLETLSPEQAQENMRFYEEYQRRHKTKPAHKKQESIGFAETPGIMDSMMDKAPADAPAPASQPKAKPAAPSDDGDSIFTLKYNYPSQGR
ncbi:MAG: tetratricopeptide repeat protein [Pseudomonadota bacterium]|nr:tetratricopeptide repeat protein [Pseudomonadota bacterium]